MIRNLNDRFRTTGIDGKVVCTQGVSALGMPSKLRLYKRVREFNDFNEENDPYGEHDFGKVQFEGTDYFWKIDYYDTNMKYGSEDPSDPQLTTRVLTLMRADEY